MIARILSLVFCLCSSVGPGLRTLLAFQHLKIREGSNITSKQQTWQKDNTVTHFICQMSRVDEEVYCYTNQWNILLIQSYLTCPLQARFITLLKHSMKASLSPSSLNSCCLFASADLVSVKVVFTQLVTQKGSLSHRIEWCLFWRGCCVWLGWEVENR